MIQALTETPGSTSGTAIGINTSVTIKSSTINPTAPATLPFAVATIMGIKGAPPPKESTIIPIRTPSETGSQLTMPKANKGTMIKFAISARITMRIFLTGAIICATVKPNPSVSMLPETKPSMERLNTISNISFILYFLFPCHTL